MDLKESYTSGTVAAQQQKWEATVTSRTTRVFTAIEKCKEKVREAQSTNISTMQAKEKEIRWAITSIYNYDTQDALNNAMTAARAEMGDLSD